VRARGLMMLVLRVEGAVITPKFVFLLLPVGFRF
jgi:hypothetical protein